MNCPRAATVFDNIIDTTSATATDCYLQMSTPAVTHGTFEFQALTASNQIDPIYGANQPVAIAAATQNFVFGFTPSAAFGPTELPLVFSSGDKAPVSNYNGVNTFFLSASTTTRGASKLAVRTVAVPAAELARPASKHMADGRP